MRMTDGKVAHTAAAAVSISLLRARTHSHICAAAKSARERLFRVANLPAAVKLPGVLCAGKI